MNATNIPQATKRQTVSRHTVAPQKKAIVQLTLAEFTKMTAIRELRNTMPWIEENWTPQEILRNEG